MGWDLIPKTLLRILWLYFIPILQENTIIVNTTTTKKNFVFFQDYQSINESQQSKAPHSFVITRGEVGKYVALLEKDFRKVSIFSSLNRWFYFGVKLILKGNCNQTYNTSEFGRKWTMAKHGLPPKLFCNFSLQMLCGNLVYLGYGAIYSFRSWNEEKKFYQRFAFYLWILQEWTDYLSSWNKYLSHRIIDSLLRI